VSAAHYASAVRLTCCADRAAMKGRPSKSATNVSELLFGEAFDAFEIGGGWAWGQSLHDGYVGYVAELALGPVEQGSTHWVSAPDAWLFSAADIKSPPVTALPMNAQLSVTGKSADFHVVGRLGFVHDRHVSNLAERPNDPLDVAKAFLGTPYLWGGRTRRGIDCSGLIQAALMACGLPCPRDTDQQRKTLGQTVDPSGIRQRDIIFFPGHVGIMASDTDLLHANAFWMDTVVEPLADVIGRLRPDHAEPILAVRRLTSV
jgi:cell wall-associated NlpC family hydrolase